MISNRTKILDSILSWNIQDSVGDKTNKFEIAEFVSLFSSYSIVCLQETKLLVKIEGFMSYNSLRSDSRSGGVCILIQNNLRKGITSIKCECEDFVVIKLDKHFFKLDFDLFLICFYISPSTSSYAKKSSNYTENTFESLNNLTSKLREKGEVILCGDANTRTGKLPDFISSYNDHAHDVYQEIGFSDDDSECRNNSDSVVVSPHSTLFLDLVINNQLKILNGRTLGDTTGKATCHKWNGSSAVDYFVASTWIRDKVDSLQVLNFNSYSDHCPLLLKLSTNQHLSASSSLFHFDSMPNRFKWNNGSATEFMKTIQLPALSKKLDTILEKSYPLTDSGNADISNELTNVLLEAAEISLKRAKPPKKLPHKKWFDRDCFGSKRNLNRLANRLGDKPENSTLRSVYQSERNKHTRLILDKRQSFLHRLNQSIEDGHVLDWKKFNQLKQENESTPLLDKYDLASFYEFFTGLYMKDLSLNSAPSSVVTTSESSILNDPITPLDLQTATKGLKCGKSCSADLISNDMLKNLSNVASLSLLKVFNHCLETGKYPWHTSVITPIFKSGNPFSPDNYRAIAVGSCMGKLFSSILLARLLEFKKLHCPDPKEQLGFTKGAQTNDHVLTLKTIIDKYTKKQRARVFTCFVDLRKAFDTVSRDLLLYKVANLNIGGNFFSVINDMYNKSLARIKINRLLSPEIEIKRGTEQGHPLSPDLFKIFIKDLSDVLKSIGNFPNLDDISISHLLWADDLVLLALDPLSLQHNISVLNKFCIDWGLQINLKKTKIVTFCPTRQKPMFEHFFMGSTTIEHAEKYCYLGIMFHRNGSFNTALDELRAKSTRALYSLKGKIIKGSLSFRSLITLFDSLIKPVLLYGCQILAPHHKTISFLNKISSEKSSDSILRYLAQDTYEKFHLKFLNF